ncbi:glycosyltransferase family 1 protein [Microbacterium sp. dk485]|uniref:glycosyltransferase family 1 protein n=1 Tax=Microbacterium sp. dk485 TaxID=2560021 RepID=UPI0010745A14|nr:glycosyltransferase family 1 protein [Microbacterium sp. dk485]TFV83798.1 glycosyltransferase family 1 protein [Microbacterium sp. dk485]
MTRLLIISFSDLASDARLQRQIAAFDGLYEVVTAGWGDGVARTAQHIRLPVPPSGRRRARRMRVESVLLRLGAYRLLHATTPLYRAARRVLRDVRADIVLANDIDAAPLAYAIAPASRVHVDLHEFFPGLHDDNPAWARLRGTYNGWLVRRFAAPAASTTTVAQEIAERYRDFGLSPAVVTNASRRRDLPVRPVSSPLRIVHSGAALAGRHLETMMRGVAESRTDAVLTMYLMPNDPGYLARLRALADELGPRVRIEPPIAQPELVDTLARHDVGIHILPATSTNHTLALPNKFFDFVQARLGVIVGPTAAMAGLTRRGGFGAVTAGFTAQDVTDVVDSLTPAQVAAWKEAADAAAPELSADSQTATWVRAIEAIATGMAEE